MSAALDGGDGDDDVRSAGAAADTVTGGPGDDQVITVDGEGSSCAPGMPGPADATSCGPGEDRTRGDANDTFEADCEGAAPPAGALDPATPPGGGAPGGGGSSPGASRPGARKPCPFQDADPLHDHRDRQGRRAARHGAPRQALRPRRRRPPPRSRRRRRAGGRQRRRPAGRRCRRRRPRRGRRRRRRGVHQLARPGEGQPRARNRHRAGQGRPDRDREPSRQPARRRARREPPQRRAARRRGPRSPHGRQRRRLPLRRRRRRPARRAGRRRPRSRARTGPTTRDGGRGLDVCFQSEDARGVRAAQPALQPARGRSPRHSPARRARDPAGGAGARDLPPGSGHELAAVRGRCATARPASPATAGRPRGGSTSVW